MQVSSPTVQTLASTSCLHLQAQGYPTSVRWLLSRWRGSKPQRPNSKFNVAELVQCGFVAAFRFEVFFSKCRRFFLLHEFLYGIEAFASTP